MNNRSWSLCARSGRVRDDLKSSELSLASLPADLYAAVGKTGLCQNARDFVALDPREPPVV